VAEVPGCLEADQQCTNPKGEGVAGRSQLKATYVQYKQISGNGVEKTPQHIYRR